jgi:hypothetical protein
MPGMQSAARRQLFICYFLRGMKRSTAISVVALFINDGRGIVPLTLGWIAIFGTFFPSPAASFYLLIAPDLLAALRVAHGISELAGRGRRFLSPMLPRGAVKLNLQGAPSCRRRLSIAECSST